MYRALLIVLCFLATFIARAYLRSLEDAACRRRDCGDGVGLLLRGGGGGCESRAKNVCLCVRR
jgi:hypothetical protein